MTDPELLAEAGRRGIELYPDGTSLRYRGPRAAVAALKPKLAERKAELLAALTRSHAGAEVDPEADRIARLDQERCARDRVARRGYDFDPTAPSHARYAYRRAQELAREAEGAERD